MLYNTSDKKLVVVLDAGTLPELGYICGPILHPSKIRIDAIQKLVSNRRTVYECNPKNTDERVKLTLRNVRKVIFQEPPIVNETIKTIKPELIQGKDANVNTEERSKNLINEDKVEIQSIPETEETIEKKSNNEFVPELIEDIETESPQEVYEEYTEDSKSIQFNQSQDSTEENAETEISVIDSEETQEPTETESDEQKNYNKRKNRKNRK